MNTFLPFPDFKRSAECLDRARLGKQRVEAKQIVLAIERGSGGWFNHPTTQMWREHPGALARYGFVICCQWRRRGYKDSLLTFFCDRLRCDYVVMPPWIGDEAFHASHRSNLLRKDPEWYGQFGWTESLDLPYVWPVS